VTPIRLERNNSKTTYLS